jgi:hypothetical protein
VALGRLNKMITGDFNKQATLNSCRRVSGFFENIRIGSFWILLRKYEECLLKNTLF